ncbi:MAG: acyl carrier protein [Chlorobiaceae bacterium]
MKHDEIKNKLTEIIRDILDDETITLTREMRATDIEEWDSLAHISIIVAVEKEFKAKFDLYDIKRLKNVGDMIDLISSKIS